MIKRILIVVLLAIGFFFFQLFYRAGQFRNIEPRQVGEITAVYTQVPGPEDMQVEHASGLLFIAGANRRPGNEHARPDGIYLLDLREPAAYPKRLVHDYDRELHPHGLSLWREDSALFLFVVNHQKEADFIEKFVFIPDEKILRHIQSYRSEEMCCLNDVAATSSGTFYATNDHGSRSGVGRKMEDYLNIGRASVIYFNGTSYQKVARHLNYANGIWYDKSRQRVYVAATTGKAILSFAIEPDGHLTRDHIQDTGTGVDNIDTDEAGNIWIAAHPRMLDFLAHAADSTRFSPSEVIRLTPQEGGFAIEQIYMNDGSEISAASIAVHYRDELLLGGVFDHKILRIKLTGAL